jgi:hypothetical protein
MCTDNGLNYSTLAAPQEVRESAFFRALPTREQQLLSVFLALNPAQTMLAIDSSQCVSRSIVLEVSSSLGKVFRMLIVALQSHGLPKMAS